MTDRVIELECNIDDMTSEEIAFAMERLMEAGAKDVYTMSIGMKKSRPGYLLTVMTTEYERERMLGEIFKYTSTIGVREILSERYLLDRAEVLINTSMGPVRCKMVSGYGVAHSKYEYEDLARIAKEQGLSIAEVKSKIDEERL